MEALRILGLDERELHDLGVRVLKLGVLNPLDERSTRRLAAGTSTVLVVEDKLEWLETRVRAALYGSGSSPAIVGKKDAGGRALVPATGALTAESLVEPLRRVLLERIGAERLAPPKAAESFKLVLGAEAQRTPFFCSGCPHNTGLARTGRVARRRRHRLPRHGQHDRPAPDGRGGQHHGDGRRGRAMGGPGTVRR